MATLESVNYALENAEPSEKAAPGNIGGKIRVIHDSHTWTSAPSLNDVIYSSKLPVGAQVIDAWIKGEQDSYTTGKVSLGYLDNGTDAADADAFIDECDFGAAAALQRADGADAEAGIFKEFDYETRVSVTFTEAPGDDDGTVEWCVAYIVD
jgi:hypothetical protein